MSGWGEVIGAVKDPFGLAALAVLALLLLALKFFRPDATEVRLTVFLVLVVAFIGLAVLAFTRTDSSAPPTATDERISKREIFCGADEIGSTPGSFDFGFRNRCPKLVRIDDDQYCDYCRVVGNDADMLRCTFGTSAGLVGRTLQANINDSGYPNECKWVDFQGRGVPAFWRVIGNSHERVAITPVTPDGIGKTVVQPNAQ